LVNVKDTDLYWHAAIPLGGVSAILKNPNCILRQLIAWIQRQDVLGQPCLVCRCTENEAAESKEEPNDGNYVDCKAE
jgi:hypothetical protein